MINFYLLLFENCRELTFPAKSADLCLGNYVKYFKSPQITDY